MSAMRRSSSSRRKAASWLLPLLLVAAGCTSEPEPEPVQACTLIGCESGLFVRLVEPPTPPYRIEATAAGDATAHVFECRAGADCAPQAFFADFTPDEVTLRIIRGDDTITHAVTPTYRVLQPNGPQCPPTCRQAHVEIGG